jgi:60 kDa SS-A/Ro ribonucleoprotein
VKEAVYEAMEMATECVPSWPGRVVVCPDVSGSMSSPITGRRGSGTTAVRCIDVAALVAASVLRRNPDAEVLPFATDVVPVEVRKGDTVMTNAQKLSAVCGGGTSTSSPIRSLNDRKAAADLVILVSDNESWVDGRMPGQGGREPAAAVGVRGPASPAERGRSRDLPLLTQWNVLRQRNPQAKLVCLDLQPNATTQAAPREDVMNIGGFSDAVFDVIDRFAGGTLDAGHWVAEIEKIEL